MEKNEINLELRTEVLQYALVIENQIMKVIASFLNIESDSPRTIGNKSSSLSFKNKIDLLYDLEVLSKEENTMFQTLMEFRNQFLHNIDCTSFTKACELLDGKSKYLLTFNKYPEALGLEKMYVNAYSNLYRQCLIAIRHKYDKRIAERQERADMVTHYVEFYEYLLRKQLSLIQKIDEVSQNPQKDEHVKSLGSSISNLIASHNEDLERDEELNQLKERALSNGSPEKIKSFFK